LGVVTLSSPVTLLHYHSETAPYLFHQGVKEPARQHIGPSNCDANLAAALLIMRDVRLQPRFAHVRLRVLEWIDNIRELHLFHCCTMIDNLSTVILAVYFSFPAVVFVRRQMAWHVCLPKSSRLVIGPTHFGWTS
jgi:hypothetical protein